MKRLISFTALFAALSLLSAAPSFAEQSSNSQQSQNTSPSSSVSVNRPASATQPPASIFGDWDSQDPFAEMEKAQQGVNQVIKESMRRVRNYRQSGKSFEPDADFLEQNGQYVLKVDLPGMTKDQINIEAVQNMIVISGERKTERQSGTQGSNYYQFERSSGSFYRRLPLPTDADTGKIQAKYENGVLEISMPKLKPSAPAVKKVKVQ